MAKEITNYQPGPRGINLEDGSTVWIGSGETRDISDLRVKGSLPDFGKPSDQAERDADEVTRLLARVAELEAQIAGGSEPGPLDQSVEKLTAYLETVTDADEVERLLTAEKAGKSRAGAITALEARRDALLA
jgi:hypothetical protein